MTPLRTLGQWFNEAFQLRNALPSVGVVVFGGCLTFLVAPDEIPSDKESLALEGLPTVVLDAGHGGRDVGGRGNGVMEKELTLDIAQRTERLLKLAGFPTLMTRTDDSYVSLTERVRMANELKDALFVSIHLNKHGAPSSSGIESFYAKRKESLADSWTWTGFFATPEPEFSSKVEEDEHLAGAVQAGIATRTDGRNRGVRASNLFVVRKVQHPAVLIEGGFMSNSFEAQLLKGEEYRELVSMGIAEGVMSFQKSRARPAPAVPRLAHAGR